MCAANLCDYKLLLLYNKMGGTELTDTIEY